MAKDLFSKLMLSVFLSFIFVQSFGQKLIKNSGLAFSGEAIALKPYDGSILDDFGSEYEINSNSFVWGASMQLDYHFLHNVYLGTSIGYEQLTQPDLDYFPLTIGGGIRTSSSSNGFLLEARLGTHLGDLEDNGFIFRGKFGYYVGFLKKAFLNFGLIYSFQNFYHEFPESTRPESYYNLESVGIFLGIKLNNYNYEK